MIGALKFPVRARSKWPIAVVATVAVNLAMIHALGRMAIRGDETPEPTVVSFDQALPAPTPPESEPIDDPSEDSAPSPAAMPDLQLEAPGHDADSFRLPAATLDSLTASFLPMPAFKPSGRGIETAPMPVFDFDSPPELFDPIATERFYPRNARQRRIGGESVVRLSVSDKGVVTAVEVISSTPAGIFEEAAKRLSLSMHGKPALKEGKPVASSCKRTIRWNPP